MFERTMSSEELIAFKEGQIPLFDAVFNFTKYGLAMTILNGKYGVIDYNHNVVLENRFDNIYFSKGGYIIAFVGKKYKIFTKDGYPLVSREFDMFHDAKRYAEFFA